MEVTVPRSEAESTVQEITTAIEERDETAFHDCLEKLTWQYGSGPSVGAALDRQGCLVAAAKAGSIAMMEALLEQGASVNSFKYSVFKMKEFSPLHVAAYYNHLDAVKYLVEHGADVNIRNKRGDTPLIFAKQLEIAKLLVENGADINAKTVQLKTPLHMAKHLKLIKYLVENGADVNARTITGNTTLHFSRPLPIAKYLIENGADVNAKDNEGISVLHRVYYDLELVKLVVGAGADVNAIDNDGLTALYHAVGGDYVEVCKYLIEHNADVNIKTGLNEESLFICACKKGSVETVKYFIQKINKEGHSKAFDGLSPYSWDKDFHNGLHICVQANFRNVAEILLDSQYGYNLLSSTTLRNMIVTMPDVAEQALNLCVSTNENRDNTAEAIYPSSLSYEVTFDYRYLDSFNDSADSHPKKQNHILYLIMKQRRSNLLRHPLVISLLHYKWEKFARYIYLCNLIMYFIFVIFLTAFGLTLLSPVELTCFEVFNNSSLNGSTSEDCEGLSTNKHQFLIVAAVITILLSLLRLFVEVFQLCRQPLDYLQDWVNWLELPLYICSVIFTFVFANPCLCVHYWQWQIGVVSVFLAWIVLITFLQKGPLTGVYVLMFLNIIGTFLKIVFLALLLIIAFALAFYMLLFDPNEERTPFSSPASALVKVMAMTTGELDYDELYHQEEGAEEIAFPTLSSFIWIIFLVLMPVLLNNLLIGLAVGDVDALQKIASEKRIELQIDLILSIEELLAYLRIYRYCKVKQQKIQPNKPASLLPQCCQTDKFKTVLTWAASLYSKWLVTSDYLVSGETIASAIKPPPCSTEKQLKSMNSKLMDQNKLQLELSEKLNNRLQKLSDKVEQQSKKIEEQSKKMEDQSKKMAECSEQLAGEVAALREALEKVLVQLATN